MSTGSSTWERPKGMARVVLPSLDRNRKSFSSSWLVFIVTLLIFSVLLKVQVRHLDAANDWDLGVLLAASVHAVPGRAQCPHFPLCSPPSSDLRTPQTHKHGLRTHITNSSYCHRQIMSCLYAYSCSVICRGHMMDMQLMFL